MRLCHLVPARYRACPPQKIRYIRIPIAVCNKWNKKFPIEMFTVKIE